MNDSQEWTIGRLLGWTTEYLQEHQAETPRLDAEVLLSKARGCERIELYTAFDEVVTDEVRTAFRELVRRRARGEPVAYLVGRREFYSLDFLVTRDVLIPRPETEFVVIALLDLVKERGGAAVDVVDVGTGSGVIAVCAAKHAPQCRVTAVDFSGAALDVGRRNAEHHGVAERINFLESNLLAALPAGSAFDFVVSNPPYVAESELANMSPVITQHEPRAALVSGPTGMETIERLIAEAGERLKSHGWLITEISPMIENGVRELIARDGRFEQLGVVKDLAGLARVVQARRRGD